MTRFEYIKAHPQIVLPGMVKWWTSRARQIGLTVIAVVLFAIIVTSPLWIALYTIWIGVHTPEYALKAVLATGMLATIIACAGIKRLTR